MGSLDNYSNKTTAPKDASSLKEQLDQLEERVHRLNAEKEQAERTKEQNRMDILRERERVLNEQKNQQNTRTQHADNGYRERQRNPEHRLSKREQRLQEREQRRQERLQQREDKKLRHRGIEPDDYNDPTTETELDPYSERIIQDKYMQRNKGMRKSERKLIEGKEIEGNRGRQNSILYLAVIGLGFIMFLYFYIKIEWMSMILLYVGLMMFLPVGMILGWAFLDPYMRCKTMRRMTHKNYGIVNFVGKGNKIVSKIKNFDDALVWRGNSVWAITREHIYQLSKNGDTLAPAGKIDPESVVTLVETVPVLFVDLDSMQPFSLARDRREGINPLELGSALKSWVDNEKAKALGLRKNMDIMLVLVIICSVIAIGLAYINMNNVTDMMEQITALKGTVSTLVEKLNNATVLP